MDISRASSVICLTVIAVIALNILIYLAFRRGIKIPEIEVMSKLTDRSPWKKEQEELNELSKLVEDIQQTNERENVDQTQIG